MLSRPSFKDSLSYWWKCCQWANLNHQPLWGQPACTDPSRGSHKGLASGHVRTNLKGQDHSRDPLEILRPWFEFNPPSALSCFFPLDSTSVGPKSTPDKHPSNKLHLSLHPREQTCNIYQNKIPTFGHDFYFKITGYTCIYILKPISRIQNARNKEFVCECGYF